MSYPGCVSVVFLRIVLETRPGESNCGHSEGSPPRGGPFVFCASLILRAVGLYFHLVTETPYDSLFCLSGARSFVAFFQSRLRTEAVSHQRHHPMALANGSCPG